MTSAAPIHADDDDRAGPFLKWAGGKGQLLEELRKYIPSRPTGTFFEPFCGAAAVFFGLRPAPRAVLGDTNRALIETMRAVRTDAPRVIRVLLSIPDTEAQYYKLREAFNLQYASGQSRHWITTPSTGAAWMIYLNKTCYNGLWRVNRKGGFNVPYDGSRTGRRTVCDAYNIRSAGLALRGVKLTSEDFERTVALAKRGDIVYFDPPYVPASDTADFTAYTKAPFGPDEQARLAEVALALKKIGVTVVLSNSDTPIVRKLYARGFTLHSVQARRNINSKGAKRGKVSELIIT